MSAPSKPIPQEEVDSAAPATPLIIIEDPKKFSLAELDELIGIILLEYFEAPDGKRVHRTRAFDLDGLKLYACITPFIALLKDYTTGRQEQKNKLLFEKFSKELNEVRALQAQAEAATNEEQKAFLTKMLNEKDQALDAAAEAILQADMTLTKAWRDCVHAFVLPEELKAVFLSMVKDFKWLQRETQVLFALNKIL